MTKKKEDHKEPKAPKEPKAHKEVQAPKEAKAHAPVPKPAATTSPYAKKYREEIVPLLLKQLNCGNVMECPRLKKIVVNSCVKEATQDRKALEKASEEIMLITGQRPLITRAKKSIANFKLRQGLAIGCQVTLRGKRMYEFFNRLANVALPRVRDFKGVSAKGFDGRGNYTMGLTEQTLFPEIPVSKAEKPLGMNVTFVTTARKDDVGKVLLKAFGLPFKEN